MPLIDVATFPGTDEDLAKLIRSHSELGPVLLLSRQDRLDQIIIGLKSGAAGVLKQTSSGRDLRAAVHAIASGFVWCDKGIFESVTEYLLPVKQLREPRLTVREKEVLHCIGQGQTNKEIASRLHLSEQTVKVYVSGLLRKAGVPSRGGLALLAVARGAEAT
jgi:DNA-binding NarL/FixJ family response regulator